MRLRTYIVGLCLLALELPCMADKSSAYMPLETRLQCAEHVVVGVATNLVITDQAGKIESSPKAKVTGGHTCNLTVEIVEVIKSNTNPVPNVVTVIFRNKSNRTVDSEKNTFIGKKLIYLLRGNDYVPVDGLQFIEPVANVDEIRKLMAKQK